MVYRLNQERQNAEGNKRDQAGLKKSKKDIKEAMMGHHLGQLKLINVNGLKKVSLIKKEG